MKQKLALCCSLIHYPKLLVLDEPTTGVDAVSRKEFWELLKGLKEKGITIIVSTPYMDEANLCDRVSLIQSGSILKTDQPSKIAQGYGQQLYDITADNMYNLIVNLENYPNTKSVFPFGHSVHYTDNDQDFQEKELKDYLSEKGIKNIEIRKIKPGIEDVFMKLMQIKEN